MDDEEISNEVVGSDKLIIPEEQVLEGDKSVESKSRNVPLREQDRFLPIANILKIMKSVLPENGKIGHDAKRCVQECVSEFISFITSEASELCLVEKRKCITGMDILCAMCVLGFDNYIEHLLLYLKKYKKSVSPPETSENIMVCEDISISPDHVENEIKVQTDSNVIVSEDPEDFDLFTYIKLK